MLYTTNNLHLQHAIIVHPEGESMKMDLLEVLSLNFTSQMWHLTADLLNELFGVISPIEFDMGNFGLMKIMFLFTCIFIVFLLI